LLRDGLGKFFLLYVLSLKEQNMDKLLYLVSFKWVKDLRIAHRKKCDRKRIAYCEKRWDKKLRGLR